MVIGTTGAGVDRPLDWVERARRRSCVSVDYRLAPGAPAPGAASRTATPGWSGRPSTPTSSGSTRTASSSPGASAGGGLAAGVALLARDRGGPALLGQMLICPMLDDRNDTPSSHQIAGRRRVGPRQQRHRLEGPARRPRGGPSVSPYAAPARADRPVRAAAGLHRRRLGRDLPGRGLSTTPPASRQAGGAPTHVWPGGFHGFDGFAPRRPRSPRPPGRPSWSWLRRLLAE